LLRVARSHIRVGTFEYFAMRNDVDALRVLVDHVVGRHFPELADARLPALALLGEVGRRQAELIARWQLVGFIHGVMNTDNMLVSGETIDYGPCAFMDAYDPATVFSSIDRFGRYAYENQPAIARWNIACLARALIGVIGPEDAAALTEAQAIIDAFPQHYEQSYKRGLSRKLGLSTGEPDDDALARDLLQCMHEHGLDMTLTFRHLTDLASPAVDAASTVAALFAAPPALQPWLERYRARLQRDPRQPQARAADMAATNPALIPRNHLVEAAIRDAEDEADFARFHALVDTLAEPYRYNDTLAAFARPPRPEERVLQTFCGT
jgi:uncharacterized protein YdiU (UPF0061 family)